MTRKRPQRNRQTPANPGAECPPDAGGALVEFARRLADFGLGAVDAPILDDLNPRADQAGGC